MTVAFEMVTGPLGPDTITVPGDPRRLRRASAGLRELIGELDTTATQLRQADAPKDVRGRTVRSLSRVAGRTGRVLQADVEQLTDLADAVQEQAERLDDAQAGLDDLRRRWRQARADLRTEIDVEAREVIRSIDADIADEFSGPVNRLAGLTFPDGGRGGAMLSNGRIDRAMNQYRGAVRGIVEDWIESMRRVNRIDDRLIDLLPRSEKTMLTQIAGGDHQVDANVISRPDDIDTVGEEIQQAARALNRLSESLPEIRLSMREGRMTPDDERVGSMEGFQRTWTRHLDELRADLNHARRASTDIADQLRQLDERGAREVRRAGRGDDD